MKLILSKHALILFLILFLTVAKCEPYGKSVDVYSFGILLWELCSLTKPFTQYPKDKFKADIVDGGKRPKTDGYNWPPKLQAVMKNCWSADPSKRPSFSVLERMLGMILEELKSGDEKRSRRKSFT